MSIVGEILTETIEKETAREIIRLLSREKLESKDSSLYEGLDFAIQLIDDEYELGVGKEHRRAHYTSLIEE